MAAIQIGGVTLWNDSSTGLWHRFDGTDSLGPQVFVVGLPLGGEWHRITGGDGTLLQVNVGYQTSDYDDLITTLGGYRGRTGILTLPDSKSFPKCTFLGARFSAPVKSASGYVIAGTLVFRQRA
jgi:hypothetical protein